MQTIICRFKDEAEFYSQLQANDDLSFFAEVPINLGVPVSVTIMIQNHRERCTLTMHVIDRTTLAVDEGNFDMESRLWRYRARVHNSDRVWLEAFLAKLNMLSFVQAA